MKISKTKSFLLDHHYRLEVSEKEFQELKNCTYFPHIFTPTGEVILHMDKFELARVNLSLMERIADEQCQDEYLCLLLHKMIDDLVVADGLHTGYPNTWPWIEGGEVV